MVGMVVDDLKLFVIAIDPATGRELWHQRIGHSEVTPGEPAAVALLDDDRVAYLRPGGDDDAQAQLAIADAHTGADLATSPPAVFEAWPYPCADHKAACAIAHGSAGGREYEYRLDVATGEFADDGEALPPGARLLDSGSLLDLGDRPGNTLAWLNGGALAWSRPVEAAFPPGFSSDNGWTWRRFDDQRIVVGSVFGPSQRRGPERVRDLERDSATAALRMDTGEVVWRDAGSSMQCHIPDGNYPVRCRAHGAIASHADTIIYERLDVTVEGFDVATGKTTWSIPIGPSETLVNSRADLPIAGATRIVVRGASGPLVLDYAAGRVSPPVPGATLWCMSRVEYDTLPAYRSGWDGTQQTKRPGGMVAAICDAEGRPASEFPGRDATVAAGAQVGRYVVIAARNGYVGFRIR